MFVFPAVADVYPRTADGANRSVLPYRIIDNWGLRLKRGRAQAVASTYICGLI
jgi:hypothetical protein